VTPQPKLYLHCSRDACGGAIHRLTSILPVGDRRALPPPRSSSLSAARLSDRCHAGPPPRIATCATEIEAIQAPNKTIWSPCHGRFQSSATIHPGQPPPIAVGRCLALAWVARQPVHHRFPLVLPAVPKALYQTGRWAACGYGHGRTGGYPLPCTYALGWDTQFKVCGQHHNAVEHRGCHPMLIISPRSGTQQTLTARLLFLGHQQIAAVVVVAGLGSTHPPSPS
jgi:hypothetical protein